MRIQTVAKLDHRCAPCQHAAHRLTNDSLVIYQQNTERVLLQRQSRFRRRGDDHLTEEGAEWQGEIRPESEETAQEGIAH